MRKKQFLHFRSRWAWRNFDF